jgi:4-aminobutyrate aminotransferase/(S)-3-amino-2-methylpropionate transaminase
MDAVHVGGLGGTYGGNPVACAAALGALEAMRKHDLTKRARELGGTMQERLAVIAQNHPEAADIRGRGAMMAVEIVGADGLTPDPVRAGSVSAYCHARGVVTLTRAPTATCEVPPAAGDATTRLRLRRRHRGLRRDSAEVPICRTW